MLPAGRPGQTVPTCSPETRAVRRYRTNRNTLLAKVMLKQPWADGMAVRGALDSQLDALLGPKTAEDEAPVGKKKLPRQVRLTCVQPDGWPWRVQPDRCSPT